MYLIYQVWLVYGHRSSWGGWKCLKCLYREFRAQPPEAEGRVQSFVLESVVWEQWIGTQLGKREHCLLRDKLEERITIVQDRDCESSPESSEDGGESTVLLGIWKVGWMKVGEQMVGNKRWQLSRMIGSFCDRLLVMNDRVVVGHDSFYPWGWLDFLEEETFEFILDCLFF